MAATNISSNMHVADQMKVTADAKWKLNVSIRSMVGDVTHYKTLVNYQLFSLRYVHRTYKKSQQKHNIFENTRGMILISLVCSAGSRKVCISDRVFISYHKIKPPQRPPRHK